MSDWDDDAFFSSVNWEAQEAQAARSRPELAAQGVPSRPSAGPAQPESHAPPQQQAPAGGPLGAGLRSLFWSGNRGAAQQPPPPLQASHSGPPGPSGGVQPQQQPPFWQAGSHGGTHQLHRGAGQCLPQLAQCSAQQHHQHQQQQVGHGPAQPWQAHHPLPNLRGPDSGGFSGQGGLGSSAGGAGSSGMQQLQYQQQRHFISGGMQGGAGASAGAGANAGAGADAGSSGLQYRQQRLPNSTGAYGGAGSGGLQQYHHQQQEQRPPNADGMAPSCMPGGPAHGSSGTIQQQQQQTGSGSGSGPLMHGQLSLGHDKQLQLQLGYHDAIKAVLTRLKCTWDAKARAWRFPISDHDRVLEELARVKGVRVRVEPLHQVPMSVIQASLTCPDDSDRYCHIPTNLESQLMPFQREGVKFALRHGGRALIGDEMGLGKTVQAIAVAAAYRDEWPVLIIAPSSLREQWADALHRWLGVTEDHIHVVHSQKDAANVPKKLQFLIASYNFVPKMDLEGRFKMIILDESHCIKDHAAQRTKATVPLLRAAKRVILLTGTPALNKPKEIFQQLAALVPSANLKMKHFGERYCTGNHFDKYGGACNLSELNALLKGTVMVRRLKNEVLTQLPKKRRQQVFLSLEGDAKRQLQGLQQQLDAVRDLFASVTRQQIASGGAVGSGAGRMEENNAIMQMYQKTAELKAQPVEEYIQLLLEGGQKFLLFAHHTALLDAAEHSCNKKKAKYIRIDGKTPASERQKLVNRFQENEDFKVAILSIRAAGVGLTLTAASTVVFAEMTWTPGEIIQAEDRAHRIGQASSVNVYFLHVKNSIDDIIWASVQNKLENVGQALDGQDQSMEVTAVRHMPAHGQRSLDGFLSQMPPTQQQQDQGQQMRPGSARIKSPSKSPGKAQPTLHAYFSGSKAQQQQQQQGRQQQPTAHQPKASFSGQAQQPQTWQGGPGQWPCPWGAVGAQQQQGSWGHMAAPLHDPSAHANTPGPQQHAHAQECQPPDRGAGNAPGDAPPQAVGTILSTGRPAGGQWNKCMPQQQRYGPGGLPSDTGRPGGGQENGDAAGSGLLRGGALHSMAGVKRTHFDMQQ